MSKRRMNGDGTITQRADGRWEARLSLPNGSRKSFYGKTKEDVNKKMKQAAKDVDNGLPLVTGRQTVKQYLESWIIEVKPLYGLGTYKNYEGYIKNHIVSALGVTPLTRLSVEQAQRFYSKLVSEGLAFGTVRKIHGMLHRAFNDALRTQLIQRNIFDLVKPPKLDSKEMITLNEEQARIFLEGVKDERFEALYVLAITTGMREGELLGLRWKDVDLEKGVLLVRVSLHRVQGEMWIGDTKTKTSRRRIALTPLAIEKLRHHSIRQNEERLFLGSDWDESLDLVFRNTRGKMQDASSLTQVFFPRILKQLKLPKMRFHDLRHTAATLLLAQGVNVKVVSEMLGHSDIAITLRVYGHVLPHMQQTAVDIMQRIVAR